MKAYKCDVCDKLYVNPIEFMEKTDPVTGVACGFIPTGLVFTGDDGRDKAANHDICPDCIAFFRKLFPIIRYEGGTSWMVWPK